MDEPQVPTTDTEMPQTEVLFRTIFMFVSDERRMNLSSYAIAEAKRLGWYQSSVWGYGFSKLTLVCTAGEIAEFTSACHVVGLPVMAVYEGDAPHRPENWSAPCLRDNWSQREIRIEAHRPERRRFYVGWDGREYEHADPDGP